MTDSRHTVAFVLDDIITTFCAIQKTGYNYSVLNINELLHIGDRRNGTYIFF
jgi:hypothetical protein